MPLCPVGQHRFNSTNVLSQFRIKNPVTNTHINPMLSYYFIQKSLEINNNEIHDTKQKLITIINLK